jgi:hypothetical protein
LSAGRGRIEAGACVDKERVIGCRNTNAATATISIVFAIGGPLLTSSAAVHLF